MREFNTLKPRQNSRHFAGDIFFFFLLFKFHGNPRPWVQVTSHYLDQWWHSLLTHIKLFRQRTPMSGPTDIPLIYKTHWCLMHMCKLTLSLSSGNGLPYVRRQAITKTNVVNIKNIRIIGKKIHWNSDQNENIFCWEKKKHLEKCSPFCFQRVNIISKASRIYTAIRIENQYLLKTRVKGTPLSTPFRQHFAMIQVITDSTAQDTSRCVQSVFRCCCLTCIRRVRDTLFIEYNE